MLGNGAVAVSGKICLEFRGKTDARRAKQACMKESAHTVLFYYALAYVGVLGNGAVAASSKICLEFRGENGR